MYYNVSQLLKEPVGSTRTFSLTGSFTLNDSGGSFAPEGQVSMMRTDKGIWVDARMEMLAQATCSRCLERFTYRATLVMGEEYLPTLGITGGRPLPSAEGNFTIDQRHGLDLTGALREYTITSQPMKPLCSENCRGLCSVCGARRGHDGCECGAGPQETEWGPLVQLLDRSGR